MNTEVWVAYDFYTLQNIILLIFSSHLKYKKKLELACGPYKNMQWARFGPGGHSLLTSNIKEKYEWHEGKAN